MHEYTLFYNEADQVPDDWRRTVFIAVAEHLRAMGYRLEVETRESMELEVFGVFKRRLAIRDSLAVIQDARGLFRVLDCHDWPDPEDLDDIVRDPRCRLVLKCQHADEPLAGRRYRKVRPWTYFESHWPRFQTWLPELRPRARETRALYFRGNVEDEREPILRRLEEAGILGTDWSRVALEQYFDEMSRHRLALSLPGMGEICHRDLEGFCVGTPVLRPRLPNRFHEDLEPDHHYISVDTDVEHDPLERSVALIRQRFFQVVDDREYLDWVAANAARWYDRNVRVPESLDLTAAILDLPR